MEDISTRAARLLAAFEQGFFHGTEVEFELIAVEGPTLSPAEQDLLRALGDALQAPLASIARVGKTAKAPSGWHLFAPFDEMMRALPVHHFAIS